MQSKAKLLKEIHAFLARTKMNPATFGHKAAGNSRLVKKLEDGGTVSIDTADVIRAYMAAYEPEAKKKPRPLGRAALLA